MNIGIVTTWFERGAAYVSRQYMNSLSKHNSVYIYARGGENYAIGDPRWDLDNVTWGERRNYRVTDIVLDDFEKWIDDNNIETILFNEQRYWEPVIFAKNKGVKVGAYIDYYKINTKPLFGIYDFLICNTKRHYSVFCDIDQSYYVPWGTDINLFKPVSRNTDTVTFFVSAGYAPKRKGVDSILKAFDRFGLDEDYKLIIHSQVDLLKTLPECKNIVEKLTKHNKLEVIENNVPAPGLYYMADVYLYPSWLDGIGLTLPEAISCGLAIITTDEAPMNEFGNDSFSRYVKVKQHISREDAYYWPLSIIDVNSLFEYISYFIKNKDKLHEMKLSAREYAEQFLDWEKNTELLEKIFSSSKKKKLDDNLVNMARNQDKEITHIVYRAIEYIKKIDKINKKISEAKGKIGIYCAGVHTEKLYELTSLKNKWNDVVVIIDKEYKGELLKKQVIAPEQIKNYYLDMIIISSYKYQNEVKKYLLQNIDFKGSIIELYDDSFDSEFYEV